MKENESIDRIEENEGVGKKTEENFDDSGIKLYEDDIIMQHGGFDGLFDVKKEESPLPEDKYIFNPQNDDDSIKSVHPVNEKIKIPVSEWEFEEDNDFVLDDVNYAQHEREYSEDDKKLKDNIGFLTVRKMSTVIALFEKDYKKDEYDPRNDKDIIYISTSPGLDGNAMDDFAELDVKKHPHPYGEGNNYEIIFNRGVFNEFKKKTSEACDRIEDFIDENVSDNDIGLKTASFLKVQGITQIRRALKGYPSPYISSRTPLAYALGDTVSASMSAFLFGENKLENNIKKYGSSFPVYDFCIQSEEQLDTLTDYWEEKQNGKLNSEKILHYRRTLYTQTVKLLNQISAIDEISMNPEANKLLLEEKVCSNNEPFHMNTHASRGLLLGKSTLEAYKTGLENGWDIDDIPVIAMFNYLIKSSQNDAKYTSSIKLEGFKKNDKENYQSEEHKAHIDKMNAFYEQIKKNPLMDANQRTKVIDTIRKMVKEGDEKGYFVGSPNSSFYEYFKTIHRNVRRRDAKIARGKENACHAVLIKDTLKPSEQIDQMLYRFNSERSTVLFWGRESSKHVKLRKAVENMQHYADHAFDRPKRLSDPINISNIEEYIINLEEVVYRADKYIIDKKTPNTPAGKERLRGAKELKRFAEKEIEKAFKVFRRLSPEDSKTSESLYKLRRELAKRNAREAEEALKKIKTIPQKGEIKDAVTDMVADIVVNKILSGSPSTRKMIFSKMGLNVFKEKIKKTDEFKSMMNDIYSLGNTSGKMVLNELENNRIFNEMEETIGMFRRRSNKMTAEKTEKTNKAKTYNVPQGKAPQG